MLRQLLVVSVFIMASEVTTAQAQKGPSADDDDAHIRIDWTTRSLQGLPRSAGQMHRIEIRNLSPLCFSTSVAVEIMRAPFDAVTAGRMFAMGAAPEAPGQPETPIAVEKDTVLNNLNIKGTEEQKGANKDLDEAISIIARVDAERIRAHRISATLAAVDCTVTWDTSMLLREWELARAGLIQVSESYEQMLKAAEGLLIQAETDAGGDAALLREVKKQREILAELELAAVYAMTKVAGDGAKLDAALNQSTMIRDVDADADAEGIKLVLTSKPVGGGSERIDTFDIPLRRLYRLVLSTGLIATGANSRHYERVNRQLFRDGVATDTVISLYHATTGNGADLVNPALMANVSIWNPRSGVGMYLSAGTTLRTVNSQVALEPLVGIAFGLLDRLLFQLGLHYGREENLRIQQSDVRSVPTAINRPEVIGTKWVGAFQTGFSLKIN